MTRLLIIFLLTFYFKSQGQNLDRTFYLLGTLEDYIGRPDNRFRPTKWGELNILHQDNSGQIKRIEEISQIKFGPLRRKPCGNCNEFYCLKSKIISKKINRYYKIKKGTLYGRVKILDSLFVKKTTRIQNISFVSGQFLTAGRRDSVYRISLYNSPERFRILKTILVQLNAKIISEEKTGAIPYGYHISFIPDNELKIHLDKELQYKSLDKELKASR